MTEAKAEHKINIAIDEGVSQGRYSNLVMLYSNATEFVVDFAILQPQQPLARIHSRIILNPVQAKRLGQMLSDQIHHYEQTLGPIRQTDPKGSVNSLQ